MLPTRRNRSTVALELKTITPRGCKLLYLRYWGNLSLRAAVFFSAAIYTARLMARLFPTS